MANRSKLRWKKFSHPDQVKSVLWAHLSTESTVGDIKMFAEDQDFECSDLVDDIIYCSTFARNLLFIFESKWLMKFYFDDSEKLIDIAVELGHTAL